MATLDFSLHAKQKEIFLSDARFKVVAAGRRGGKTHLAKVIAGVETLKNENDHGDPIKEREVWYIAPTFEQGKKIMWRSFKDTWQDVIKKTQENVCLAEFDNGRVFRIMGADRPDSLRGIGLSYVILDEYAFMRPEVWDLIIRPTLAEARGGALFIGTPEGKNHFYDLWLYADREEAGAWAAFHFTSRDNPMVPAEEINMLSDSLSSAAYRQEIEASFEAAGGGHFSESEVKYAPRPDEAGTVYMAVDPAGYGTGGDLVQSELKRRDETAIAVVEVSTTGWFVHDIQHGRWDIRETALRILRAAQKYRPSLVGIEKGSLYNAIDPYLKDEMRRLNVWPVIEPVTHGGKKKVDRIAWALKGRFEKGRITLKEGEPWNRALVDQLLDFPNPMAHDDLIDALAYIDQVATTNYNIDYEYEEFVPLDSYIGI